VEVFCHKLFINRKDTCYLKNTVYVKIKDILIPALFFAVLLTLNFNINIVAFHEQTGHKVAIKILNKKKIRVYGVFEKVKRELKILRRFNNPHTIKLFEFIDTQSEIFMVLEYAAGGELFDLIARREKVSKFNFRFFNICNFQYSCQNNMQGRYFNK